MKPIVEKVLKSGIVDRGMVELLERWGNLPEGSVELLNNETLKNATREQLQKFAEDLANEVSKAHDMRETNLDLDRLRWPVEVSVLDQYKSCIADKVTAVIDRMGRYFFRVQDVKKEWFTPGFTIVRGNSKETILESDTLFIGSDAVAIQVTTRA
jgi:hypothetical protein